MIKLIDIIYSTHEGYTSYLLRLENVTTREYIVADITDDLRDHDIHFHPGVVSETELRRRIDDREYTLVDQVLEDLPNMLIDIASSQSESSNESSQE